MLRLDRGSHVREPPAPRPAYDPTPAAVQQVPPIYAPAQVISGPVASLPPPWSPPHRDLDAELERARAFRVFAVVLALGSLGLSVVATLTLIGGYSLWLDRARPTLTDGPSVAMVTPQRVQVVDTGLAPEDLPPVRRAPSRVAPTASVREVAPPPPAEAGPGPVRIVLEGGSPAFTSMEVVCPSEGFRERGAFSAGTAEVPDVPAVEDCVAFFKGGPPAKARVSAGDARRCRFLQANAVCE